MTARHAAIEAAPYAPEALRERVARAICESDGEVWMGDDSPFCEEYRINADAAIAVVTTPADGGAA